MSDSPDDPEMLAMLRDAKPPWLKDGFGLRGPQPENNVEITGADGFPGSNQFQIPARESQAETPQGSYQLWVCEGGRRRRVSFVTG